MLRTKKRGNCVSCSLGKCLIFWYMHHNAVLRSVNIQIAGKWRDCSDMVYSAKCVLREVVFYARKCGIFCNSTLGPARNLNAMYLVAGKRINLSFRQQTLWFHLILCWWSLWLWTSISLFIQWPEGASEKITAAIRFKAKSSCDGNDETESCGSRWRIRVIKTCTFGKIKSKFLSLKR